MSVFLRNRQRRNLSKQHNTVVCLLAVIQGLLNGCSVVRINLICLSSSGVCKVKEITMER